MVYCDQCVHKEVCGKEGVGDNAMTYCNDRLLSCGDCVDRQELLSYYEYDNRMPAWFIESMPYVQPVFKWISTENRLPELTSDYLVVVGINRFGLGMYDAVMVASYNTVYKKWHVYESKETIVGEVTKWMPLPIPC